MGKTRRHSDKEDRYRFDINPTFVPTPPPPEVVSTSSKDIKLKCKECGNDFLFSEKDQEFYKRQGFVNPKRCFRCRSKKREARNAST